MKSKEAILMECLIKYCSPVFRSDTVRQISAWFTEPDIVTKTTIKAGTAAMQEYADQQTAELRREVEELRKIREAYQALTGELNKRAGII
jgi:hypothetical protein